MHKIASFTDKECIIEAMVRTTISLPDDLHERTEALNVSELARRGIEKRLSAPRHLFNTNRRFLPDDEDGTAIYAEGMVATYGDREEYGSLVASVRRGDGVLSYVNDDGVRAFGWALADGDDDPVSPDDRLFYPPSSDVDEYHVPVYWDVVLPPGSGIGPEVLERIAGRPIYSSAYASLDPGDRPDVLLDVLVGRSRQ